MATTAPVLYDVNATAKAWTDKYTVDRQTVITNQTNAAKGSASGLAALKSSITTYQASLTALSAKKSMLAQAATLSNTAVGSATAGPTAAAGTYSFFVESLASTNQIAIDLPASSTTPAPSTGKLVININGAAAFNVDLNAADTDGTAGLTPKEIAAAINAEPHNASMVTASVITIGGTEKLVLTSGTGGTAGAVTLSTTGMLPADSALQSALEATPTQLVLAKDAKIWLGAQGSGTPIVQGSNTFTGIAGVSVAFTKVQTTGEAPVTLSVGLDTTGTAANAQGFIDAYNQLKTMLDNLTDPGSVTKGTAPGPYTGDSGMLALREQMVRTLRENSAGALSTYGISATRNGLLSLNTTRLNAALNLNPAGLDAALGSNSATASSGVVGKLDKYLSAWSNFTNGQLSQRATSITKLQATLTKRQADFDKVYAATYDRYKMQYTKLNDLKTQMAQNTDLFDALFGSKN